MENGATGNREGREMEEEGEGKEEWGPGAVSGKISILDLGLTVRCSVQTQSTMRPGSSGLEDSKRRNRHREGADSVMQPCTVHLVRMSRSDFRFPVTGTSQTHNYRTVNCLSLSWCQSRVSRIPLPFDKSRNISCLFTFRSRGTQDVYTSETGKQIKDLGS